MRRSTGIIGATAVGGTLVAALLRRRVARFEIVDRSMSPALRPGDYVVAVRPGGALERGSPVVFPHPTRPGFDLVKRVVGLPGERIDISGGSVAVDSRILAEPWADGPTYPDGSWQLGPQEVFVLGDRRPDSADDSRMIGPVPRSAVPWVVVLRYWPPGTAGRI